MPRPSRIIRTLFVVPRSGRGGVAYFWRHTRATLSATALGFLVGNLIAIFTATAFLYNRPLERALMPIALALRSVPLVAITPLLLRIRFTIGDLPAVQANPVLNAIFGTETFIKIVIVVIICYFPTLVNAARGLSSVPKPALELMHTLRASRWQTYWKLRVPTGLPLIFAAFRVTSSSAVLAAVVAEWLSSDRGLGSVIKLSLARKNVPQMWMGMVISCVLAIAAFAIVSFVQRFAIPWYRSITHLESALEEQA
jgi:NitT/TauT family transport system permease protein